MHATAYLDQPTLRAAQVRNSVVTLIAQHNEASIARPQLLDDALHLGVHPVASGDDDDGHVLIHQSQGPVLHLARQNALTVHQSHLLHL